MSTLDISLNNLSNLPRLCLAIARFCLTRVQIVELANNYRPNLKKANSDLKENKLEKHGPITPLNKSFFGLKVEIVREI